MFKFGGVGQVGFLLLGLIQRQNKSVIWKCTFLFNSSKMNEPVWLYVCSFQRYFLEGCLRATFCCSLVPHPLLESHSFVAAGSCWQITRLMTSFQQGGTCGCVVSLNSGRTSVVSLPATLSEPCDHSEPPGALAADYQSMEPRVIANSSRLLQLMSSGRQGCFASVSLGYVCLMFHQVVLWQATWVCH